MLNKNEILEMYQVGELKRMSWVDFLSYCDASHYRWTGYVLYPGDKKVRIFEVNIFDDPDVEYIYPADYLNAPESEIIIDWGEPVVVVGATEDKAYIVVEFKTNQKDEFAEYGDFIPVSGILHPTKEEAEKELDVKFLIEEILGEEEI